MAAKQQIFCPIRKEWVALLPEEQVRQQFLQLMIEIKGYPPPLISVEKSLRYLPHLSPHDRARVPDRRADIICFASDLHPLLLVECKAKPGAPGVVSQVIGYNHYVRARFIAFANAEQVQLGWYDSSQRDYRFVNYLPTYAELSKAFGVR